MLRSPLRSPLEASVAFAFIVSVAACSGDVTSPGGENNAGVPDGWAGNAPAATHTLGVTTVERHGGTSALYLRSLGVIAGNGGFAVVSQFIKADTWRGKRVRWSGWVKSENVKDAIVSGLWMRVDGPGVTQGFDNMGARAVIGTTGWHQVTIVMDVPSDAIGIALGVLFDGVNALYADDLVLEAVATSVPRTNPAFVPYAITFDVSASYASAPTTLRNLGFEGLTAAVVSMRQVP